MDACYHIVIADDEEQIRAVVKRMVQRIYPTARISLVKDGVDALVTYLEHGADLIITDNGMPRMDGLSVVRTLRSCDRTTPIIMLSGTDGIEQEACTAGVTIFVRKPVTPQQLEGVLTGLLPTKHRSGSPGEKPQRRLER
jgi:CheY-like chemotaxis protein